MVSSINIMDSLSKLGIIPERTTTDNNTTANSTAGGLPPGFMDTFIATAGLNASPLAQLLLFVHRQLGVHLGIDPSLVLTILGVLWGTQYFASQAWAYVNRLTEDYLMSSITISQDDSIYYHLMEWLSKQPKLTKNRYLTAQTVWKSAWEADENADEEGGSSQDGLFWTDVGLEVGGAESNRRYLNFSNQAARSVSIPESAQFVDHLGQRMLTPAAR